MRFYFARHGESEANVQQVFWNQPGRYGPTIAGRAQAEELADRFAGIAFVALYCSPVLRAVQTAEVVGRWLGLTPVVADGLREWRTGILEGQRHSKETERLHWWATSQWMEHGNHYARIEGGESCDDIKARCVPFVAGLEERYRHVDADLLLISHGGTLRCMLPLLVSNIDDAFALHRRFDYAAPIVVELRNGEWVCLRWGKDDFDTQR